MEELHRRYGEQAEFLAIYVREAHPGDGAWPGEFTDQSGAAIHQPRHFDERAGVAAECSQTLRISMPLVVDEIDDRVGRAYSGMPDRLYVIDPDGRVAFKSGRGPFGFKPGEMEQSLVMLLLDQRHQPETSGATSDSAGD